MGGNLRIFELPDGTLLGFYREQGGLAKRWTDSLTGKVVYGYLDTEDDDIFWLISCVRPPKSMSPADHIVYIDKVLDKVVRTDADFLGYAYQLGPNAYVLSH